MRRRRWRGSISVLTRFYLYKSAHSSVREHICPDIPAQHRPITTTSSSLPPRYSSKSKPNQTQTIPAPANYHNIQPRLISCHHATLTLLLLKPNQTKLRPITTTFNFTNYHSIQPARNATVPLLKLIVKPNQTEPNQSKTC